MSLTDNEKFWTEIWRRDHTFVKAQLAKVGSPNYSDTIKLNVLKKDKIKRALLIVDKLIEEYGDKIIPDLLTNVAPKDYRPQDDLDNIKRLLKKKRRKETLLQPDNEESFALYRVINEAVNYLETTHRRIDLQIQQFLCPPSAYDSGDKVNLRLDPDSYDGKMERLLYLLRSRILL